MPASYADAAFDPQTLRQQFPLIDGYSGIYLDNGATTQKPRAVLEAIDRYYRYHNANVHRAAHRLSEQATREFEAARQQLQRFINARHSAEIIWTSGTTEAINLVANSYGLKHVKPGDEIVVSLMEHHANIVPWQLLAERSGALLKVIPLNKRGELELSAYQQLLSDKTRIVALTHVSNALGTVKPLKHCIDLAHRAGAVVVVDGAQAVAHFAVDVQALNCDFYAFSGHKAYGPTGIGVLYGRQSLLEAMPPWKGGGEMIERVSFAGTSYNVPPFRFEAGTPNIAGAIGFAAAVSFLSAQQRGAIELHEQRLLQAAIDGLSSIKGVQLVGAPRQRAALLSFLLPGYHSYDIGALLDQQGIAIRTGHHCAMPLMDSLGLTEGTARASFALYNTLAEVDSLVAALDRLMAPALHPSSAVSEESIADTADTAGSGTLEQQLLSCRDWQSRYSLIMKLGKNRPPLADHLRSADHQLHGCTNRVWLVASFNADSGCLSFQLDSDARVIRGLGEVLLEAVNSLPATELVKFDLDQHLRRLGLIQHLSPSRSNGLRAIMDEILRHAQRHQPRSES